MTFLACAAMLTSAIALNSCKSDDPIGGYEGDAEVVKTEFAIALPDNVAGNGARHMPSATVQEAGASQFQGITGIFLVPFVARDTVEGVDVRLDKNIVLTENVDNTDIAKPSKAKVYSDVAIPVTTGTFLFYGKSAATGSKFEVGSLYAKDTASNTPDQFKFELDTIQEPSAFATMMGASGVGGKLMTYLTTVACASDGSKCWYQYPTTGDSLAMHNLFDTLATMHGLSSFEVERVLTDLNKTLKPLSTALATAIKGAINNPTYATVTNDTVHLIAALTNFPGSADLPEGSVDIEWDGTAHKFKEGDYSGMAQPSTYVYPAQLWYRVNSKIQTSNKSEQTTYNNTNDWAAILGNHDDGDHVDARTRAVAIVHPIQYAVGRLDVKVKLANGGDLEDNSDIVEEHATNVDASEGFKITGILVGGQKSVGFNFEPIGANEFTIYDKVMTSTQEAVPADMMAMPAANFDAAQVNHTLVLENDSSDVRIAVEMQNTTGVDFYGVDGGLIPKGGKFYVVATLKVDAAANATIRTAHKVFQQDYVTKANLTLTNLRSAYNTIPDLRTPQLEIGFSVDLTWQNGNEYTIDFE